jgi:hypothetical protein
MKQLTLYSRSYCHLCDDMLGQLRAHLALNQDVQAKKVSILINVIDVDADDKLVALYDELVPVLTAKRPGGQEIQICHYFLDVDKLEEFLNE